MRNTTLLICVLLVMFCCGFAAEYVKVNINYHIEMGSGIPGYFEQSPEIRKQWLDSKQQNAPFDYYYSHGKMDVLHNLSLQQLIIMKWFATLFFTLLFLLLTLLALRILIPDAVIIKWTIIAYSALFILSFIIYIGGKVIGYPDSFYAVSRKIAGALQSPVPIMLIYPAWILYQTLKPNRK